MPLISELSTEHNLLLSLCRQELNDDDMETLSDAISQRPPEYRKLMALATYHKVGNLVAEHLLELSHHSSGLSIPNWVFDLQVTMKREAEERLRQRFEALQEIRDKFASHGIRFGVLKGHAYLHRIYKKPHHRPFADLDLLVRSDRIIDCHRLIVDLGYHAEWPFAEEPITEAHITRRAEFDTHLYAYRRDEPKSSIDLHHSGIARDGFDLKEVLDRAEDSEWGVLVPTLLDMVCISCSHAAHHFPYNVEFLLRRWARLGLYVDVREAWLAARRAGYDDQSVMRHISDSIAVGSAPLIVALTQRLLGTFAPQHTFLHHPWDLWADWRSRFFCSRFEWRLLEGPKEHGRIMSAFEQARQLGDVEHIVTCFRFAKRGAHGMKEIYKPPQLDLRISIVLSFAVPLQSSSISDSGLAYQADPLLLGCRQPNCLCFDIGHRNGLFNRSVLVLVIRLSRSFGPGS